MCPLGVRAMIGALILEIDSVSKSYRRRNRRICALEGVSLELERGDFVGLHGRSRSGKSTLLRIAAGVELPDSGSVSYQGQPLASMSSWELTLYRRREVGFVWGSECLTSWLTAIQNVVLPLALDKLAPRTATRRAQEFLEAVGVADCRDARPDELSDGERVRVAIAQALVVQPRLVLADEPATNLGPIEQDGILELFQSLAEDAKVAVLITGSDATALMRSRIIGIDRGRLTGTEPLAQQGELVELPLKNRR